MPSKPTSFFPPKLFILGALLKFLKFRIPSSKLTARQKKRREKPMALLSLENRGVVLLLCLVIALFQVSNGKVYKVGDVTGWTTIGNFNYSDWAYNKTFQIQDVIVFEYNPQFHNVMQVTHAEYRACNVSSPIVTYTSGNDSIVIQMAGHHFFLCGVPGHCQSGQRVDIHVRAAAAAPPPGTVAPPGVTIPPSTVPLSSRSHARPNHTPLGWLVLPLSMLVMFCFGYH